mmetsp:Transcript_48059/g.145127  ORF Transcript_48059/g.145127 Transcript_48059/m.145127 type:complete len:511 (-) Transcript_48059:400-1932(-)
MAKLSHGTDRSPTAHTILWITYLNVALYALCYQLQRPVEPYLVQTLTSPDHGKDGESSSAASSFVPLAFLLGSTPATAYGRLQSFFSLVQTFGSPLVGILLDRIGVRITSVVIFAASAASYAILAHATTLGWLFASKIPAALQHAFLVAQAAAATTAAGGAGGSTESTKNDDAARASALARMTTAYTVGATFGPALGGYLAQGRGGEGDGDLYAGARLAVVGSLVSVVLSWIFLPDSPYHAPSAGHDEDEGRSKKERSHIKRKLSFSEDVGRSASLLVSSALWPLLLVKVVGGISDSMHSTALPLALTQSMKVEPSQLGAMMSTSMFAVAGFGALAIRPLTGKFGTNLLARSGLCVRGAMCCAVAYFISVAINSSHTSASGKSPAVLHNIVMASVIRSLASHVLATSLTTMTTGAVQPSERGALLGLEHGLFSGARVVGPTFGTYLLTAGVLINSDTLGENKDRTGSFWTVGAACSAVDSLLVASLLLYGLSMKSGNKRRDDEAKTEKGC